MSPWRQTNEQTISENRASQQIDQGLLTFAISFVGGELRPNEAAAQVPTSLLLSAAKGEATNAETPENYMTYFLVSKIS